MFAFRQGNGWCFVNITGAREARPVGLAQQTGEQRRRPGSRHRLSLRTAMRGILRALITLYLPSSEDGRSAGRHLIGAVYGERQRPDAGWLGRAAVALDLQMP